MRGSDVDLLLDTTLEPLLLIDGQDRVLHWNWGAATLFGLDREAALGRPLTELIAVEESRQELENALAECRSTGSAIQELDLGPNRAEPIRAMVILRRGTEGTGEAVPLAVSVHDVTAQKRLESQLFDKIWNLTEAQNLLRSVLDGSADYAIIALDQQGRVMVWSEGAQLQFGYSEEEARGKDFVQLAQPADARLEDALAATMKQGRAEQEVELADRKGRRFPCRVALSRRLDAVGRPVGHVVISKDITTEIQAAQALRRKTAFVTLLQNVAVAANESSDVDQAMQRALDEVCAATGWPLGHLYVRSGEWAGGLSPSRIWHLEDPTRFQAFRSVTESMHFPPGVGLPGRVLSTGRPAWIVDVTKDSNFPRGRVADEVGLRAGFAFPVLVGTEIVAVLEFFSDETHEPDEAVLEVMGHIGTQLGRVVERHRAQLEQRRTYERTIELERLKEVDRFKEEFLRTVSHDLNTPLTPIKIQLHRIQSGAIGSVTEAQAHALGIVNRNIDRLGQLVHDLLDVARIQSGRLKLEVKRLKPRELVKEAAELFVEPARQQSILLEVEPGPEAETEADGRRLLQVMVNLLSNALKFTPAGGRVRLESSFNAGAFTFRVSDTGRGLAREEVSRLFKPFSRLESRGGPAVAGTGLGLFICKSIVEQHGGQIGCESPGEGQGATFWFTLPRRDRIPLQAPPPAVEEEPVERPPEPSARGAFRPRP